MQDVWRSRLFGLPVFASNCARTTNAATGVKIMSVTGGQSAIAFLGWRPRPGDPQMDPALGYKIAAGPWGREAGRIRTRCRSGRRARPGFATSVLDLSAITRRELDCSAVRQLVPSIGRPTLLIERQQIVRPPRSV